MFFIRADANEQIGMGHIMRCLTIAGAAKKSGIRTVFLLADETAVGVLEEQGQEYCVLHIDFRSMEAETEEDGKLWSILQENRTCVPVLLLDSYHITPEYLERIRKSFPEIKTVLMEDYGKTLCTADTIINYNIYGEDFKEYYKDFCRYMLLGCKYMPLRGEFTKQPYAIREKVKNVLLTTGGSDSLQIAPALAKSLALEKEFCFHVVCGRFSESLPILKEISSENENIKIYTDVKAMWELMAECDVAISAAGTTLYELCAIGLPTICFSFAENQRLPAQSFEKRTPMLYAGDYGEGKDSFVRQVKKEFGELTKKSMEQRREISKELRSLVDGRGAERIVAELFKGR